MQSYVIDFSIYIGITGSNVSVALIGFKHRRDVNIPGAR